MSKHAVQQAQFPQDVQAHGLKQEASAHRPRRTGLFENFHLVAVGRQHERSGLAAGSVTHYGNSHHLLEVDGRVLLSQNVRDPGPHFYPTENRAGYSSAANRMIAPARSSATQIAPSSATARPTGEPCGCSPTRLPHPGVSTTGVAAGPAP